ncbi:hypothetical protein [Legionella rowbothamii]|uniref:hypothetical protein n=1 Tax=Legionella rowbothamii TaxID=96229 RepID=UPI00105567C7|nr:hypothetical protein [Legionella rowbothamii]
MELHELTFQEQIQARILRILVTSDNGTQYKAIFTNRIGQAISNAALLTVSQPPPVLVSVMSDVPPIGPIANGGTTNDAPTFNGTATVGSVITAYDNGIPVGTLPQIVVVIGPLYH